MPQKTALVTGCSRGGVGEALAIELANKGYLVFAGVRNVAKAPVYTPASAPSPNTTPGGSIRPFKIDVAFPAADIKSAVAELRDALSPEGRLDVLINNAGVGAVNPILDADEASTRQLFDVNFFGVVILTQACVEMLVEARGTVVNISSVGGILSMPWNGIYGASKAALTLLGETLRLELAPLGVKVITVVAGGISTNFRVNDVYNGLPETSRYKSAEKDVSDFATGKKDQGKQTTEVFAKSVVRDIMGGKSGKVYRGGLASIAATMAEWLPTFLLDWFLVSGSGLAAVSKSKDV